MAGHGMIPGFPIMFDGEWTWLEAKGLKIDMRLDSWGS